MCEEEIFRYGLIIIERQGTKQLEQPKCSKNRHQKDRVFTQTFWVVNYPWPKLLMPSGIVLGREFLESLKGLVQNHVSLSTGKRTRLH